jgi:hypothetical protein
VSLKINMNVAKFKEELTATVDQLQRATRPAAQAGSQLIYDRARSPGYAPVSEKAHYFHIEGRKYGPFQPGNLRDSIYQVFSRDKSFRDVSTYEVSWNKTKAPYGFAYEYGNSKRGAKSFIARAVVDTRKAVRDAIKERFIAEVNKK